MLTRSLTLLSLTALPSVALAAPIPVDSSGSECAVDADCGEGFVCEVTGGSACACDPSTPCDCPVVEYRSCVPGPCTSDADCDAGMVCATYEVPCASSRPCSSDGECEEAPACEPTTESICAPRWVLPCQTATDCGDGFECKPSEVCTCSGGAATDPGEPDSPPPSDSGDSGSGGSGDSPPPPSEDSDEDACSCEPTGQNACIALEIECDDASTCPSGWSCEHMTATTDCAEAPGDGSGSDSSGSPPSDGGRSGCNQPAEPPPPARGVCFPPYGVSFDSGIPRSDSAASGEQHESGTAVPTSPPTDPSGTPGDKNVDAAGGGCAGGSSSAIPVAGLALLMIALWRRRGALV